MTPTSSAGYSGTPLAQKLGIKEGHRVAVLRAPKGLAGLVGRMPAGARLIFGPRSPGPYDLVILFVADRAALSAALPRARRLLDPYGGLWVSWPKKTSALYRDLTENHVRAAGLAAGVVDNKVCAVDEVWSGLRLVVRTADRPPKGKPS